MSAYKLRARIAREEAAKLRRELRESRELGSKPAATGEKARAQVARAARSKVRRDDRALDQYEDALQRLAELRDA